MALRNRGPFRPHPDAVSVDGIVCGICLGLALWALAWLAWAVWENVA